jgi:hypothetical protein
MDELEISGRRFLSTRRAAKDHKYTSDYVGQLIRGGKVTGKKVGRSWYVDEQSLNAYLNGEIVPETLAQTSIAKSVIEKTSEPVVEVKKEVPTFQQVESRTSDQSIGEKKFEPVIIKSKTIEEHHIPIRTKISEPELPSIGLRYVSDDEPALPQIQRKTAVTNIAPVPIRPVPVSTAQTQVEDEVEIVPDRKIHPFAMVGVVIAGLAVLSATALLSATLNTRIVVEQGQVASIGYTFQ